MEDRQGDESAKANRDERKLWLDYSPQPWNRASLFVFSSSSRWFAGFHTARTAQADADQLLQFAARSRTTSACCPPPSAWRSQYWLPQLPLPPGWSCMP